MFISWETTCLLISSSIIPTVVEVIVLINCVDICNLICLLWECNFSLFNAQPSSSDQWTTQLLKDVERKCTKHTLEDFLV